MIQLEEVFLKGGEFSNKTFGVNRSFIGPLNHLKKEIKEVIESNNSDIHDPHNGALMEFADCLLLLLDAFRLRHPDLTPQDLLRTCLNKIKINEKREWGKPNSDGSVEHIR